MKERQVAFSPDAYDDLIALYDWIADAADPVTALNYAERVRAFCEGLSVGSERGHRRDDLRPGLRIIGFEKRITIAFTVERERVIILRLFYGGQNWDSAF